MVTVVGGENPVFIRGKIENISSAFSGGEKTVYYGDELSVDDFFGDLLTGSLFCSERMIIVRSADKSKSEFEKQLLNYLSDPSDNVHLVLEYQKIPAKVQKAASELGAKTAQVHSFKKAYAADQKNYAARRLHDKGISCASTDLLVALSGENIEELAGTIVLEAGL